MQKQRIEYIIRLCLLFSMVAEKNLVLELLSLVWLIEKWKHQLDMDSYASAVLVNLSKTFDTINYNFIIEKHHAYGFGKNTLYLVYKFLKNRGERVKINMAFNTGTGLISGAPLGSILWIQVLHNIYLNVLFFFLQDKYF